MMNPTTQDVAKNKGSLNPKHFHARVPTFFLIQQLIEDIDFIFKNLLTKSIS